MKMLSLVIGTLLAAGVLMAQDAGTAQPVGNMSDIMVSIIYPAANEIRLRNPRLPPFLDELVLRNLMLKQSSVDLKVRRHANEVSVEILERRGQIQVSAVFGRTADAADRAHKNG